MCDNAEHKFTDCGNMPICGILYKLYRHGVVRMEQHFGRWILSRSGENIYDKGNLDLRGGYGYSVPAHIGI